MANENTVKKYFGLLLSPCLLILSTACGGGAITPQMVAQAQKHDPQATEASMQRGKVVLETKCNSCHKTPGPTDEPQAEWPEYVEKMGKLAKLTDDQQQDLLHYVMGAAAE